MNILEIIIVSLSLSMDSFATSICKGMDLNNNKRKESLIISIWFSIFQTMMPILGYFLSNIFYQYLYKIDHFIALIILCYLGISMIISKEEIKSNKTNFIMMFILSLSISIDAFTIGITYSFLNINILIPSICNFIITFITSFIGVLLGNFFGKKIGEKAKILGGLVLISLGIKIFLTHLLT